MTATTARPAATTATKTWAPPDGSPSYGALLPPGRLRGSPHLLSYQAGVQLPGGFLGSPTAAAAPGRIDWAAVGACATTATHQTQAVSAFAAGQATGGLESPAPAVAPHLNPFAAQRKRGWELMQQQPRLPGMGPPEQLRQRELDALRKWSVDCARRHSAPYQGADMAAAAVAAAAFVRCMPSVSSVSLPPTQKPRSSSVDLRELSQLDCAARGFRPASSDSPSVVDIHRMAARLSGIVDAAREEARPGESYAADLCSGSFSTCSLPHNLGSHNGHDYARREFHADTFSAPAQEASMQRPTTTYVSGSSNRGQPQRCAVETGAVPDLQDAALRSASSGGSGVGIASWAASASIPEDPDPPMATAWSWGGIGGAVGPQLAFLPSAATTGRDGDGGRAQDNLHRLRPSVLAGKPPLGWQLGTRSNSGSVGTLRIRAVLACR